ncbi:MAG: PIN domain-containing protein [Sphingomicrobium sp.]
MTVFVDTNVLIYAYGTDPRAERARDLLAAGGWIAIQSLNEFADVARRKLRMEWPSVADAIGQLLVLCTLFEHTTGVAQADAVRLAERYDLRIFDAMLLAIALAAGCDEFLSEDLHDGLVIDGRLTVRNPFAAVA